MTEKVVVQEDAPTVTGAKKMVVGSNNTGNLIMDIAHEVETLTKTKALHEADWLADNIDVNYFTLGGFFGLINTNGWFEGFADFDTFVFEKYGLRVARPDTG